MAGGVSEALSVLSAAIVPTGPSFVRRPEFSQELVREARFNRNLANPDKLPMSRNLFQRKQMRQLLPCLLFSCASVCQPAYGAPCSVPRGYSESVLQCGGMLDQRCNKETSSLFHFCQVDLLRLRCEGQPSTENLEGVVTRLVQTDQLTQETLDDMLCRTPTGKRRPVIEERKTSRRTLRLLQSSLLTE